MARHPAPPPLTRQHWVIAATIAAGAFMSGIDASVVNGGLPQIAADLDASLELTQWVSTGFLLATAAALPACGWMCRRFGAGRVWMTSLLGFVVTSALCAAAPTMPLLIAARVVQGICAGWMIPAGQTQIGATVGPARLGSVMTVLGLAVSAAPAFGPTLGGLMLGWAPWPWLFLINVPVGLVAAWIARRVVPAGLRSGDHEPFDAPGLALASAALTAFVLGMALIAEGGGAVSTKLACILVATVAATAFVIHSRQATHPALDLSLYRKPGYRMANIALLCNGVALLGGAVLLPLWFQLAGGRSAFATGMALMPTGVATMVTLPFIGGLVDRIGGGRVASLGGAVVLLTAVPLAFLPPSADPLAIQALLIVRGAALALCAMPVTTTAYRMVAEHQLADAATQTNIVLRAGGALGSAVFATLAATYTGGTTQAFQWAFGLLCLVGFLGLLASLRLARLERL